MTKLITVFSITLLFGFFLYPDSNAHQAECKCECPEKSAEQITEKVKVDEPVQVVVKEEIVEPVEEDIVGVVTAMDENAINIKDDFNGTLHKLWSEDPKLIRNVEPGYRVEAKVLGEKVLKLKTIGTPAKADPTIIQIKKMIVDPAKQ